jgi:hypothetical protein
MQRIGADDSGDEDAKIAAEKEVDPELAEPERVTPLSSFLAAAQALGIAAVLYFLTIKLDSLILSRDLPDQYTARNITITVRTILRGIMYLVTFMFAANGVGLSALTLKLLIFGDDEPSAAEARAAAEQRAKLKSLPKISLTSDIDDVMRAFDQASDVNRYRKKVEKE